MPRFPELTSRFTSTGEHTVLLFSLPALLSVVGMAKEFRFSTDPSSKHENALYNVEYIQ